MIASLEGTLQTKTLEGAVINVGGVGFAVTLPASTLSSIGGTGDRVRLYTHLQVRDDALNLFGFTSAEELGLFQMLIGITGLGPKLALAMLSTMSPEKIASAIAGENIAMLTQVPGVGKKVAARIVVELKDKVGAGLASAVMPEATRAENADALAALLSLGYSALEANEAVASLPLDVEANLEDRVRLALGYLANR
jgi:holliday junction DNA helicase RuvA